MTGRAYASFCELSPAYAQRRQAERRDPRRTARESSETASGFDTVRSEAIARRTEIAAMRELRAGQRADFRWLLGIIMHAGLTGSLGATATLDD